MKRLELLNVTKKYGNKEVLKEINFSIDNGEFVAIMGRSGSGKTTLLNVCSTIDTVSAGRINCADIDITNQSDKEAALFRKNELGFVFQDYMLLDSLTIRQNIAVSLSLKGVNHRIINNEIEKHAKQIDIFEELDKYPYQVSGGQKQRASIIRAVIKEPLIVFADEPTGALDLNSSISILEMLKNINKKQHTSILMVTHDVLSASYADKVIYLKDGKIEREMIRGESREKFYESISVMLKEEGASYGNDNS